MCYSVSLMFKDEKITFVFIQVTGWQSSTAVGGGPIFQESIAKWLVKKGFLVFAISNPSDITSFSFLHERKLVAKYKNGDSNVLSWFFFSRSLLKSELIKISQGIPKNAVYIITDPFPPDIMAAIYLKRTMGINPVVTMHHITPSPFFHIFRRGIVRTFGAWIINIFALATVKIFNIPVFLDNAKIASSSGWNLKGLLMEMPSSIDQFMTVKSCSGKHDACFVGRLRSNKGISDLIHCWKLVTKSIQDAHLTLIGSDTSGGKYQKMIDRLGLSSKIEITGYLSHTEKEKRMNQCTIFPFPSYEEGWSLAVMEAIDRGLLPILYDIPAYDYVCSDEIKIKAGKITAFSTKIIFYFINSEERQKLVRKLQECNTKYSEEYVFKLWLRQIKDRFNIYE